MKVIEGGSAGAGARGAGTGDWSRIDVVAGTDVSGQACLRRALAASVDRQDVRRIMKVWPQINRFVLRLAEVATDLLPGSEPGKSLLQEALEVACTAHLSAGACPEAGLDLARFQAGGIAAMSRGLLSLSVDCVLDDAETAVRWNVFDADLCTFIADRRVARLEFGVRALASRAERFAVRNILVMRLLTYQDVVAIERAGIDYRSFEPY